MQKPPSNVDIPKRFNEMQEQQGMLKSPALLGARGKGQPRSSGSEVDMASLIHPVYAPHGIISSNGAIRHECLNSVTPTVIRKSPFS
jgi:hypothetical protein